jgi:hypothetical protein
LHISQSAKRSIIASTQLRVILFTVNRKGRPENRRRVRIWLPAGVSSRAGLPGGVSGST